MRLPDERYEEIKMEIAFTFEDYNVGGLPIDVFGLAEKMGVVVVYSSQILNKNKGKITILKDELDNLINNEEND